MEGGMDQVFIRWSECAILGYEMMWDFARIPQPYSPQSGATQAVLRWSGPSHGAPPYWLGCRMLLVELCCPVPQLAEHGLQRDQLDHSQSTTEEERRGREKNINQHFSGRRRIYFHVPRAARQHIRREICHLSSTVHLPMEHKITITQGPIPTSFDIKAMNVQTPTKLSEQTPKNHSANIAVTGRRNRKTSLINRQSDMERYWLISAILSYTRFMTIGQESIWETQIMGVGASSSIPITLKYNINHFKHFNSLQLFWWISQHCTSTSCSIFKLTLPVEHTHLFLSCCVIMR